MVRELIQALHLSAQATAKKMEVIPKYLDLQLLLCQLILRTPVLQAQLLHHHIKVGDGWPVSGCVAS